MGQKKHEENKKTNVIETVKNEAKQYYQWKNMVIRYVIIGFLLILLVLQFIIPHNKNRNTILDNTKNVEISQWIDEDYFEFLWEKFDLDELWVLEKIKLDQAIHGIVSQDISYVYKMSQLYLPMMQEIFDDYDVPRDLIYLSMADVEYPHWMLSEFDWKKLWIIIDSDVYEPLNLKKSTQAVCEYFVSLYDEFDDWNLVALAYLMNMWENQLKSEISFQWTDDFDELYVKSDWYYTMMAYSFIFQNLSDYINVSKIDLYDFNTTTVSVSDIKDLSKWCRKNKYSYKEIRELNPWILWNSLPKWKWEILVNN